MISLIHRLKTSLGRSNRSSLCEEQLTRGTDGLISSSATIEVKQSGLIQDISKEDKETVESKPLPISLPKHLRIEQSRRFSVGGDNQTNFQTMVLDSNLTTVDSVETKSSNIQATLRQLHRLSNQFSLEESTLDYGTRSRRESTVSALNHSREGSEILDDGLESTTLNSPSMSSSAAAARNKKAKKFKRKRKQISPPHTPPPPPLSLPSVPLTCPFTPPTPPQPTSISPGALTFPSTPPTPPPPSSLPPGPPIFPFRSPTPRSPLSIPPGPPTLPFSPATPPPPSSLPPGPPTFPFTSPTPPPPMSLPPGPPTLPFPPPTPPLRARDRGSHGSVLSSARVSLMSADLHVDDSESIKSNQEVPVCISCGIRIEEYPVVQKDTMYFCVLPDTLHNSCPNVLDWSDVPSTPMDDASDACVTHTATSTHRQFRKLLCKEDSAQSYHVLENGKLICMECLNRDGPIYHELETFHSDSELLDSQAPPIPLRRRASKYKDPIYERVASVHRRHHQAKRASMTSAEGSYITSVGRKPRSLHLGSSSDYESVQSQTNTPSKINAQQLMAKFEQRNRQSEPLPSPPPPPLPPHRNKPRPPPLAKLQGSQDQRSGSHDYESVSFEHELLNRKMSDHDYAHIGPVPSLESLDESPVSSPYVPEGAMRAKLLKIDSQGYATVIPAGDLDNDEVDCLRFSGDEDCPVDASEMVCRSNDAWRHHRENGYAPLNSQNGRELSKSVGHEDDVGGGTDGESELPSPRSTTPQDYEVPMNILQQSPDRCSNSVSPRLTRQRAVSSTSTSETEAKRLSYVNMSGNDVHEEERREESEAVLEASAGEEVFDSGLEMSADSQKTLRTLNNDSRDCPEQNPVKLVGGESGTSLRTTRTKSMTVFPATEHSQAGNCEGNSCSRSQTRIRSETFSFNERQSSMPTLLQPKLLHISLDQNRQVIV